LVSLLVGFWPAWLFAAPGVLYAMARIREGSVRFLLAWIVPAWIILELAPTKLPHYPLPIYPALAIMCGAAVMAGVRESRSFLDNTPVKLAAVAWLMMTLALAGAALFYVPGAFGTGGGIFLTILGLPILGAAGLAVLFLLRGEGENATAAAVATGALFAAITFAAVMPRLDQLMLSTKASDLIAQSRGTPENTTVAGFNEPSMVFQAGTEITLSPTGAAAADFMTKHPDARALVEDRLLPEFQESLKKLNVTAEALGQVKGMNYSRGDYLTLTLYRLRKTGP
jgi:4-amino-4-deoxy-L-arabinose transferase-like glycosyltransferase